MLVCESVNFIHKHIVDRKDRVRKTIGREILFYQDDEEQLNYTKILYDL